MAEFCIDCFMEIYDGDLKHKKIIMSEELDLCEGCGAWKSVVVKTVYKNPVWRFLHNRKYAKYK